MVTKDYSKSRMRENCTYGSVRGGQSNLIPSTRLKPPSGCALGVPGSARERLRLPGWFRGSYKCRFAEVKVGRL